MLNLMKTLVVRCLTKNPALSALPECIVQALITTDLIVVGCLQILLRGWWKSSKTFSKQLRHSQTGSQQNKTPRDDVNNHLGCASVIIYIIPRVFYFAENLFGSVLPILDTPVQWDSEPSLQSYTPVQWDNGPSLQSYPELRFLCSPLQRCTRPDWLLFKQLK